MYEEYNYIPVNLFAHDFQFDYKILLAFQKWNQAKKNNSTAVLKIIAYNSFEFIVLYTLI